MSVDNELTCSSMKESSELKFTNTQMEVLILLADMNIDLLQQKKLSTIHMPSKRDTFLLGLALFDLITDILIIIEVNQSVNCGTCKAEIDRGSIIYFSYLLIPGSIIGFLMSLRDKLYRNSVLNRFIRLLTEDSLGLFIGLYLLYQNNNNITAIISLSATIIQITLILLYSIQKAFNVSSISRIRDLIILCFELLILIAIVSCSLIFIDRVLITKNLNERKTPNCESYSLFDQHGEFNHYTGSFYRTTGLKLNKVLFCESIDSANNNKYSNKTTTIINYFFYQGTEQRGIAFTGINRFICNSTDFNLIYTDYINITSYNTERVTCKY
jgi:hypothetical protein